MPLGTLEKNDRERVTTPGETPSVITLGLFVTGTRSRYGYARYAPASPDSPIVRVYT